MCHCTGWKSPLPINEAGSEELTRNDILQRLTLQKDFPKGERFPTSRVRKPHLVELQGQLCFCACLARGIHLSHSSALETQSGTERKIHVIIFTICPDMLETQTARPFSTSMICGQGHLCECLPVAFTAGHGGGVQQLLLRGAQGPHDADPAPQSCHPFWAMQLCEEKLILSLIWRSAMLISGNSAGVLYIS